MNNFNIIWSRALSILQNKMEARGDKLAFNTWVKELKPEFADQESYYFVVPNEFSREMLIARFADDITEAMEEAKNAPPAMIFSATKPMFVTPGELAQIKHNSSETQNSRPDRLILDPTFTFDTFVRGGSNEFAYAVAQNVSYHPGMQSNNPFFIYGGVGLGKTHLINAIGNEILKNFPNAKVLYVTSETFTNELIESLQTKSASAFRNKFRNVDVLLIDDIQFIADKTSTQEEFFHTFNALKEAGKQIVISSDRPPLEIPKLEERLVSRFRGGISVEINKPEYETRVAILRSKIPFILEMYDASFVIPSDVINYIASKKDTNIRDLEGAVKRMVAFASYQSGGKPDGVIDLELAKRALTDFFSEPKTKVITPEQIIKHVCSYFNITEADILSSKKSSDISHPRQIAMYLMRTMLDMTYKNIGRQFGGKDHATVIHAESKIRDSIEENPRVKNMVDDIIHSINKQ